MVVLINALLLWRTPCNKEYEWNLDFLKNENRQVKSKSTIFGKYVTHHPPTLTK